MMILMSFVEFKRKCPSVTRTNFLTYEGTLKAIREYKRAKEIVLTACNKQYQTKAWIYFKRERKLVSP